MSEDKPQTPSSGEAQPSRPAEPPPSQTPFDGNVKSGFPEQPTESKTLEQRHKRSWQ